MGSDRSLSRHKIMALALCVAISFAASFGLSDVFLLGWQSGFFGFWMLFLYLIPLLAGGLYLQEVLPKATKRTKRWPFWVGWTGITGFWLWITARTNDHLAAFIDAHFAWIFSSSPFAYLRSIEPKTGLLIVLWLIPTALLIGVMRTRRQHGDIR
jgi:hypothetical protein